MDMIKFIKKTLDQLKEHAGDPDKVVLDPIEMIPVGISSYSVEQNGNWGYNYLEIDQYADRIKALAKRKVYVFVFDTATSPFTTAGIYLYLGGTWNLVNMTSVP